MNKAALSVCLLLSILTANMPIPAMAQTAPVKLTRKTVTDIDVTTHLETEASYAQVISPTAKLAGFNVAAAKQATDAITAFKTDNAGNEAPVGAPMTNTVQIDYAVLYNRAGLISIHNTVAFYAAGAAHPNSYSTVLNYDVDAGKALDLADMFKPEVKYLDVLATYCRANLKRRGRLDFPEGVDPKLENYDAWNITPRGLRIHFDPYQVTAYVAGPQQCVVPYSILKKALKEPARLR